MLLRYAIFPARDEADIAASIDLAWQFFDHVRTFPGMAGEVEHYLAHHRVAEKFASFAENFLPPAGDCLLARAAGGAALGTVMLTAKSPDQCEMNRMFVVEAARGSGLGRALCAAVLARAAEMGFTLMTLDTLRVLEPAIGLYRSMGFEDDDTPSRFDADNPMVLNMRRPLTADARRSFERT